MGQSLARLIAGAGLAAAAWLGAAGAAPGEPLTVCTITVNSADEKASFQRHLPPARYRFVELVERGRPDWLASACRAGTRCDLLIISGHYDGSSVFFSDRVDLDEHLPVAELERVSCSDSCSSVFAQLQEVYLFGCNTLNPRPLGSASADAVRRIVREGATQTQADRLLQALNARHGQSSRDRMRLVFKDAPVIYGFASAAPLGPAAASVLDRYFQAGGASEVGSGRRSSKLLAQFAAQSLVATTGLGDTDPQADPQAGRRDEVCRFADERQSAAQQLAFVHQLLQRPPEQVLLYLDRIQQLLASLDAATRALPEVEHWLGYLARDMGARGRVLDLARDSLGPAISARMADLARELGWLSPNGWRAERVDLLRRLLARQPVGVDEVDQACSLNQSGAFDGALADGSIPAGHDDMLGHEAVRACTGDAEARQRTLLALASPLDHERRLAQALLRHRPLADVAELRQVTALLTGMVAGEAQLQALDTLARQHLADGESLQLLLQLYERTDSAALQNAVAGVLVRADRAALDPVLLQQRLLAYRVAPASVPQPWLDLLLQTLAPGLRTMGPTTRAPAAAERTP